jgi:serine/threonine-protein kinase
VVHRDLKPGNIFLCIDPDGHLLTTKVLDFGISVMMGLGGELSTATGSLATFGTPAYMAPEAISLSPSIDARADVYGFGVLFFEALTGKVPFLGPPGLELLKRVLTEPPPRVTAYRTDLSPEIDNLIDRALSKSADDRFVDMEHLIRATEDCLLALQPTPGGETPMVGPSLIPPVKANCVMTVPMVQAPYEKDLSKGANRNVTRVLYSLASEAPRATDRAGIGESKKPASADACPRTRREHVAHADSWNPPNRLAAMVVAMVVFLIVTAWVSVPASSGDSGGGRRQSASSSEIAARARRPVVSPLPETKIPAPAAAANIDKESGSVAGGEGVRANGERAPIAIPIRTAVSHPSKIVARGKSTARWLPTADPTNQPLPPRAGRLSPSDF